MKKLSKFFSMLSSFALILGFAVSLNNNESNILEAEGDGPIVTFNAQPSDFYGRVELNYVNLEEIRYDDNFDILNNVVFLPTGPVEAIPNEGNIFQGWELETYGDSSGYSIIPLESGYRGSFESGVDFYTFIAHFASTSPSWSLTGDGALVGMDKEWHCDFNDFDLSFNDSTNRYEYLMLDKYLEPHNYSYEFVQNHNFNEPTIPVSGYAHFDITSAGIYDLTFWVNAEGTDGGVIIHKHAVDVTYGSSDNLKGIVTCSVSNIEYVDYDKRFNCVDNTIYIDCDSANPIVLTATPIGDNIFSHWTYINDSNVTETLSNGYGTFKSSVPTQTFTAYFTAHTHSYGPVDSSWNNDQCISTTTCSSCGNVVTLTVTGTYVVDTPATCTTNEFGHYEATFTNSLFEKQNSESFELANTALGHDLVLVNGLEATTSADGYKEAYKCSRCGIYYEDAQGNTPIGDETAYDAWKVGEGKIPSLNPNNGKSANGGAIAGIIIGSFFGLLLIAFIVLYILWKLKDIRIPLLEKILTPAYRWINNLLFKTKLNNVEKKDAEEKHMSDEDYLKALKDKSFMQPKN